MSETWSADRAMRTRDEVLQAVGQDDLDGLGGYLEDHLMDVGPLHWEWEETHRFLIGYLSNGYIGAVSLEIGLPITMSELESELFDLDQRLEFRSAAAELPDMVEDEWDVAATSRALADFFGVQLHQFTDALCGDWRPVGGDRLGDVQIALRWFGAGSPIQVLLGIGEDYATLARPIEHGGGQAGPPVLEAVDPIDVELRRGQRTLDDLAEALPAILAASREGWDYCRGCLEFGLLSFLGSYCSGCEYRYLGRIVD